MANPKIVTLDRHVSPDTWLLFGSCDSKETMGTTMDIKRTREIV